MQASLLACLLALGLVVGDCAAEEACEAKLSAVQEALLGSQERKADKNVCSLCQGPPGKRGDPGPPGPVGVQGPVGEIGKCNCSFSAIENLKKKLEALEDFRRQVSQYENICYAGISTGAIPISYVSATSTHPSCSFSYISMSSSDAWCAENNDDEQYVQVDLQKPTAIYGVLTRGRYAYNQWVKTYRVSFGMKPTRRLQFYKEKGSPKIFDANIDATTIAKNEFAQPIIARYVRIHPIKYNIHMSMSLELLRC